VQFENNLDVLADEVGDMDGTFVKQGTVLGNVPGYPEEVGVGFTKAKVLDWCVIIYNIVRGLLEHGFGLCSSLVALCRTILYTIMAKGV